MSERAVMKRRVRGLLHGHWLSPLTALLILLLPCVLLAAGAVVFMRMHPMSPEAASALSLLGSGELAALALTMMSFLSLSMDFSGLLGLLPGAAAFIGVWVFVLMPLAVSVSGYFLSFLRGKNPRLRDVFTGFGSCYPHALGGMLYRTMYLFFWFLLAVPFPIVLYAGGMTLVSVLVERFGALMSYQVYVLVGLILFCLLWFVVFSLVFINRILAYSLTATALAAQSRLSAKRAVRLSRKLMRGCKWQVAALFLSFLPYFLPGIICLILRALLPMAGELLGMSAILVSSLRTWFGIVAIANVPVLIYVLPYAFASFQAFYIERKREALMDEELTAQDFADRPRTESEKHG